MVSCKKKKDDTNYEVPPVVTSVLCDGNGTNSYFPLQLGNKYSYGYKFKGESKYDRTYTVTKDTVIGGLTYKKIQQDSIASQFDLIRVDLMSNNVFSYISAISKEIVLIPGTPVLDQSIECVKPGNKAKITSLSAAYKTAACSYSGLLEITEYDASGKAVAVYQYKPGVGRVHTAFAFNVKEPEDYQLKSVTLK
jgi:hypothetical protein